MVSEPVDGRVTDPDAPDLGVRVMGQEAIAGSEAVLGELEGATVDVDGNNLAAIAGFDLWAHLSFVEFGAEPSVLFFAVARLADGHIESIVISSRGGAADRRRRELVTAQPASSGPATLHAGRIG